MKGYYKGELRPCPNCGNKAELIEGRSYCLNEKCGCGCMFPDEWNKRPAFDKAIDALIKTVLELDITFGVDFQYSGMVNEISNLTGLTYEEAIEIYNHRQEAK